MSSPVPVEVLTLGYNAWNYQSHFVAERALNSKDGRARNGKNVFTGATSPTIKYLDVKPISYGFSVP